MRTSLFKHVLLLIVSTLLFSTCGKRKPPLPPVERVVQRVSVSGQQIGDRIDLSWKMPARNASAGNTLNISRAEIYRLAEKLTDPLSLTEEEFASRSTLIGSVSIEESDFGLKEKVYSDKLRILGQQARLRYAIRFVNSAGQKASYSNFFLIEPAANVAASPADVRTGIAQNAITVYWTKPAVNLDGSSPANIVGYNVYRSTEGDAKTVLLNPKPVKENTYLDEKFSFGESYRYFVRTVSIGRNAESVESFASETVEARPVDVFAPLSPQALTIASAPGRISLFYAFNLEKDIAGYRVFRSTNSSLPLDEWQLMTPVNIKVNTFQDETAVPSVVYYYFVTAIDTAGNESEPSSVVSETAL